MSQDPRIVYGACCVWWDSIDKVATAGPYQLPVCPHCGSPLLEVPDEATWWRAIDEHAKSNPGYREFIEWQRGKCFRTHADAVAAYEATRH